MHAFLIENESQLKLVSDVKIVRSLLFMVFSHLVFRLSQALCVCVHDFNSIFHDHIQKVLLIKQTIVKKKTPLFHRSFILAILTLCTHLLRLPPSTTGIENVK